MWDLRVEVLILKLSEEIQFTGIDKSELKIVKDYFDKRQIKVRYVNEAGETFNEQKEGNGRNNKEQEADLGDEEDDDDFEDEGSESSGGEASVVDSNEEEDANMEEESGDEQKMKYKKEKKKK